MTDVQRSWVYRIGAGLAIGWLGAVPTAARALAPLPLPDVPVGLVGRVHAMARQQDGAIVIGGAFAMVDGVPRSNLARLRADGSLDPDWNPSVDDIVLSLAVDAEGRVYVGGSFHTVGGQPRHAIARITSGRFGDVDLRWNPGKDVDIDSGDYDDGSATGIDVLALGAHGDVFAGGKISSTRLGQRRAIKISADAGAVIDAAWEPAAGKVSSILPDGKGSLYVAGDQVLERISEAGAGGGAGWRRVFSESPQAIALAADDTLYVAGFFGFDPEHDAAPRYVARIIPGSAGEFDPSWNPPSPAVPDALVVDDGYVYAATGGHGVVRWSANGGGTDASWPTPGEYVTMLVPGADGSVFASVYGARRALARLDGSGGQFLAVADAALPGVVDAIAVQPDGGTIVGGHFSVAGTASRGNILRLDPDGRLDPAWRPSIGLRSVDALAIGPRGEVYASGEPATFSYETNSILTPSTIVRIDGGGSGSVDADWAVAADGRINALACDSHDALYVGGYFTRVADVARGNFARVSLRDASVQPAWGTPMEAVDAIVVDEANDALYVADGYGADSHPIGSRGSALARFSNATGGLRWRRPLPGMPVALALAPNGTLYVGGEFIDDDRANDVLAFTTAGEADAIWNAAAAFRDGRRRIAQALLVDTDAVYVGGIRYGERFPYDATSNLVARSRGDGSQTATPAVVDGTAIRALVHAPNGAIYLGGAFDRVDDVVRPGLATITGRSWPGPRRAHSLHAQPDASP
ncbi:MAG TPA: hypothetical protein VFS55_12510 [Dokdonella sp.]|nr:hypothetical protein [Dokdonella sp.]